MSCEITEIYLEARYEEGLEQGMTPEEAWEYAYQCLDSIG